MPDQRLEFVKEHIQDVSMIAKVLEIFSDLAFQICIKGDQDVVGCTMLGFVSSLFN